MRHSLLSSISHHRRPPLYAESTIRTFVEMGFAVPQHAPVIRAAAYVVALPVFTRSHDIDHIMADITAHMARSNEPQSHAQILESLKHRQEELNKWPRLELPLFIHRVARIRPDDQRLYHPDQPWGNLMNAQRLVASTMLRIFVREQQPHTTAYLTKEVERLVGQFLPNGYNTFSAVRAAAYTSEEVSRQGPSTFGLKEWDTTTNPYDMPHRSRGSTGDLIYAFLTQHGPADIEDVIEHAHQTSKAKRRTVQEALNHDPANRFIRLSDRRVAANPIPQDHNPGTPSLVVALGSQQQQPPPILREPELLWLTRYLQALNDLTPPLPERAAITGQRAAGYLQEDSALEMTVVVEPAHRSDVEPQLAAIAAASSEQVPDVRHSISIASPQQ